MKTVKICLMTLAILVLGFSCSEPDPVIDGMDYEHRNLALTTDVLSAANPVRVLDHGTELYLTGDVALCNLSQGTIFTVKGNILKKGKDGLFEIQDGEFSLLATETGCNLWGMLEGQGYLEGNHFEILARVQQICGAGAFECSGGELRMTIKGENAGNQENRMTYTMEVSGSLHQGS